MMSIPNGSTHVSPAGVYYHERGDGQYLYWSGVIGRWSPSPAANRGEIDLRPLSKGPESIGYKLDKDYHKAALKKFTSVSVDQPSEPEWLPNHGTGECPVPWGSETEIRYVSGFEYIESCPELLDWNKRGTKDDVTHYRDWTEWEASKSAHSATNYADLPVTKEEDEAWDLKTMSAKSAAAMKAYREQSGPWSKGEARMDQIGRNGNDGIHYDKPLLSDEECEALKTNTKDDARSKYHVQVKDGVWIDVYDVLSAFNVTNPALQHLIKKALKPGDRGHKDKMTDMQDIIDSAVRAKELEQ